MGHKEWVCKGKECNYFSEYYEVDKQGTCYIPRFGQSTKYCTHPSIYTMKHTCEDTGTPITSLNNCPNEKQGEV
jgi:hypothetical protein